MRQHDHRRAIRVLGYPSAVEKQERKRPGRRPGEHKLYPKQHAVRFTEEQWQTLERLATQWHVPWAEVIRRLVDEAKDR
jgi:hypothetical protein